MHDIRERVDIKRKKKNLINNPQRKLKYNWASPNQTLWMQRIHKADLRFRSKLSLPIILFSGPTCAWNCILIPVLPFQNVWHWYQAAYEVKQLQKTRLLWREARTWIIIEQLYRGLWNELKIVRKSLKFVYEKPRWIRVKEKTYQKCGG